MPFTDNEVRQLLEAIERSDWDEVRLVGDDLTLVVSKSGAITPAPPPAASRAPEFGEEETAHTQTPAARPSARPTFTEAIEMIDESHAESPAPHASSLGGDVVLAPSIGLFWRSAKPGAPPFVEVGDRVEADTTVGIIEVMKLMNHVKAGSPGIVAAIHSDNGDMVEYGQPLVTIVGE